MFKTSFKTLVSAAVVAVAATAASAATLPADYSISKQRNTTNDISLFQDAAAQNAWYEDVQVSGSAGFYSKKAGMFRLNATDLATGAVTKFNAFCIELGQNMQLPTVYDTIVHSVPSGTGRALTAAVQTNIGKLVSNAWSQVKDAKSAAAFQLALWEVTEEQMTGPSLKNGSFRAGYTGLNVFDYSTRDLAEGWLSKLGSWTIAKGYVGLESGVSQDLVTDLPLPTDTTPPPAPVPLPASALMLGAALSGLTALRRRRG